MSRFRVTARRRASERVQALIGGDGWPGRLFGTPREVEVTEHAVLPVGWPSDVPPLRIAFASDFHAGPTTHPDLWAAACDALDRAKPDIVLLGGDFVVVEALHVDALAERLGEIAAPLGCYAVLGNHDYYADATYIAECLEAVGIRMLTNQGMSLPAPHAHVWICGLDDWGHGEPDVAAALDGAEGIRVVLMHNPSSLLDLGEERFDLALCGHVHGGQIALPGGRAIIVPHGPLSRRYSRGRFQVNGGTMIVSRGIGASTLPFRAFSTPEVMVCHLGDLEGRNPEYQSQIA
ncbi:MAG: metallophosphoesterase family protein [Gemmatimonadetes bacterium]|nr:metallophosphoesterase family protein [Gemmatimonadota bacterium]MDQ3522046.1 metallophosphoesterase family protein [Gemmatimonadota bacterium]